MNHSNKFFLVITLISSASIFAMQQQLVMNAALLAQIRYQEQLDAGIRIEQAVDQSARVYPKKRQPHYETKHRNQPHSTSRQLFSQHHK